MSDGKSYLFASAKHWARARVAALPTKIVIDAARNAGPIEKQLGDAKLFALTPGDLVLFIDCRGVLCCDQNRFADFGSPLRLLIDKDRLWVLDDYGERKLFLLDAYSLHILEQISLRGLIDAAPDGEGGIWLLAGLILYRSKSCDQMPVKIIDLAEPAKAIAAAGDWVAYLNAAGSQISFFNSKSKIIHRIELQNLEATMPIGDGVTLSGNNDLAIVAWTANGEPQGGIGGYLSFDMKGELLASGRFEPPTLPFALAADGRDIVFLVRQDGDVSMGRIKGAARPGSERRLLPALELSRPGSNWHRADLTGNLPPGATLAMRWATSDDKSLGLLVESTLANEQALLSERLTTVDTLLGPAWSETIIYGGGTDANIFALPFYGARQACLWIDLQLLSPAGDIAPELHSLRVVHDTDGLMQHLPMIYRDDSDLRQGRRTAFDGSTRPLVDNSMRRLVAVLETGIDSVDRSIAGLAKRLNPQATDEKWLADLALMLGLPFHEALTVPMRRNLLGVAGKILESRGTRTGLLTMLEALFPDRQIRVRDRTEQLAPIILGSERIAGNALPRLLSGASARIPKLNARLVLGRTALCPTKACDDTEISADPQVLIEIPSTPGEQRRLRTAIEQMIEDMVPAGVRTVVRWLPFGRSAQSAKDALFVLPSGGPMVLDGGLPLGSSPLGGRTKPRKSIGDALSMPHPLA
jgi:phage tail-like protein